MKILKKKFRRQQILDLPKRITPVFEDFHRLTVQESGDYERHRHNNYELITVINGPYKCNLNGKELVIHRGEFLIIKPGDTHQDHFASGQIHYVLHFHLTEDNALTPSVPLLDKGISPEKQIGHSALKSHFDFFDRLQDELRRGDRFSAYIQDSMVETFFWQIVRALPEEILSAEFKSASRKLNFYTRLMVLFSENCRHNLSVGKMASILGVSRRSLTEKCKNYLGKPPARAFLEYRIKKAAKVWEGCEKNVQELSVEFGFENPFHFSRQFKEIMGVSPRMYKRD